MSQVPNDGSGQVPNAAPGGGGGGGIDPGVTGQFGYYASAGSTLGPAPYISVVDGGIEIDGGTVTTSKPMLTLLQEWNGADNSVVFNGHVIDITDAQSNFLSHPFKIRLNGVDRVTFDKDGGMAWPGSQGGSPFGTLYGTNSVLRGSGIGFFGFSDPISAVLGDGFSNRLGRSFSWATGDSATKAISIQQISYDGFEVETNNGTQGDLLATAASIQRLSGSLIADLPAVPAEGMIAHVTDGDIALVWGVPVVNSGSGATSYIVWYNGTAWTVMGK